MARVLIVEDEPDIASTLAALLSLEGYSATHAADGQTALDVLNEGAPPEVILLDLMMPVMDGTEALAAIRGRSAVPVILCSGYTAEAVPEDLAADTATGFLQKPFSRADLQRTLASVGA